MVVTPTLLTNDHPALRAMWHPVCQEPASGEVSGGELFAQRYAVASVGGRALVAVDSCPHRGARLSAGTIHDDGCLRCPYHGWRFGADGTCVAIPATGSVPIAARANLTVVPSHTALGLVWIRGDHSDGVFAAIESPEWEALAKDGSGIAAAWLPDTTINSSASQFIDNFLDVAHFPVVHAGTFGADEADEVGDLVVEPLGDDGIRLRYAHTVVNREDPLVESGEHPLIQPRVMEYTVRAPFQARLRIELPLTGVENTIVVVASPTSARRTTLFTVMLRNDLGPDGAGGQHAIDYEMAVLAEDLIVLENLADAGMPLEVPAQVHTRADRFTVEYRRMLARLVDATLG